jgi:KH domain-containing protein
MNEYEAVQIFEAMGLGFSSREALQLKDEDMIFRIIALKDFTRRKDLREVRARVIGAKGQTKRVIEEISGCKIVVKEDNLIGIIGHSESIDAAITAITNIIKGTKQANAYRYLEKMNKIRKENKFLENIKINNKNKK